MRRRRGSKPPHKTHLERRGDALSRGHGDAHAGERAGSASDRHARDALARNARVREQLIDAGEEPRVRRATRLHLDRGDARDTLRSAIDQANADGDDLVGRIEGQNVFFFQS